MQRPVVTKSRWWESIRLDRVRPVGLTSRSWMKTRVPEGSLKYIFFKNNFEKNQIFCPFLGFSTPYERLPPMSTLGRLHDVSVEPLLLRTPPFLRRSDVRWNSSQMQRHQHQQEALRPTGTRECWRSRVQQMRYTPAGRRPTTLGAV